MSKPARQTHLQVTHTIRASLPLAALVAAGTAGLQVDTLPAGARVLRTHAFIETAFNAATTNVLDVGTLIDPDQFMPTATALAGATGLKTFVPTGLGGVIAVDTAVLAIYSYSGTAPTTGLATVIIEYVPNN